MSKAVQLLLDQGANFVVVDAYRWTPLRVAAQNGHLETVKRFALWRGKCRND